MFPPGPATGGFLVHQREQSKKCCPACRAARRPGCPAGHSQGRRGRSPCSSAGETSGRDGQPACGTQRNTFVTLPSSSLWSLLSKDKLSGGRRAVLLKPGRGAESRLSLHKTSRQLPQWARLCCSVHSPGRVFLPGGGSGPCVLNTDMEWFLLEMQHFFPGEQSRGRAGHGCERRITQNRSFPGRV